MPQAPMAPSYSLHRRNFNLKHSFNRLWAEFGMVKSGRYGDVFVFLINRGYESKDLVDRWMDKKKSLFPGRS